MKDRNYKAFYALLKRMEGADKEVIVEQYTGGRTSSLREMTDGEYQVMIAALNRRVNNLEALRAERSKALHLMQLCGVDTADWGAVNRFCGLPQICRKPFARLSVSELEALVRKLRAMRAKGYKYQAQRTQSVALPPTTTQTPS